MPDEGEIGTAEDEVVVEDDDNGDEPKKLKKEKQKKSEKSLVMGHLQHEELDWIYIGDAEDAKDATKMRQANVRYILNCTMPRGDGGVANYHERDPKFEYCRLSMADNATEPLSVRWVLAWDFFEKVRIREDGNVLVHCQQGVSRSVSMVVSYLIKYYRFSFDEAKALCVGCRKQANPNEGFEKQLRELEETLKKTNGFEKVPPSRKRASSAPPPGGVQKAARGPARGPAGPARGPVGVAGAPTVGASIGPTVGPPFVPTVGPALGPSIGPSVGPSVGTSIGPSVGSAIGPSLGPAVGPACSPTAAVGPALLEKREKKEKKEKKHKVQVGPARPP